MHPILLVGFIINLLVILAGLNIFGLFIAGALSIGVYFVLSKGAGPSKQHLAQLASILVVYIIGTISLYRIPWIGSGLLAGAIVMEILVFAIFSALER